jgi:hypothetical protein
MSNGAVMAGRDASPMWKDIPSRQGRNSKSKSRGWFESAGSSRREHALPDYTFGNIFWQLRTRQREFGNVNQVERPPALL